MDDGEEVIGGNDIDGDAEIGFLCEYYGKELFCKGIICVFC